MKPARTLELVALEQPTEKPPRVLEHDQANVADTEVGRMWGGLQRSWYEGGRVRVQLGKGPIR